MVRGSFIENWECVEKQNLSFSLPGSFFSCLSRALSLHKQWCSEAATTATQLMDSRITSWWVDLASPQPEPKDLLHWSGAHVSFLYHWNPTVDLWWCSLKRNKDKHSPNNWGSLSISGSPASPALVRVRHLALRIALQRNRVTAGLCAEGCFNQMPAISKESSSAIHLLQL